MRPAVLFSLVAVLAACAPVSADEDGVRKMIADYAAAFNSQQIEEVIAFWTPQAVHVDRESGDRTEGREQIRADIAKVIEETPGNRMIGRVEQIRFIKPDVAQVEGRVTVGAPDADPSDTSFSAILVQQNGRWMFDSIEERSVAVPDNAGEALADLQWLVGRWIDTSDEVQVDTVFRWTNNGNFLLRSYSVSLPGIVSRQGTQIIGWDPRSNEIRSWSFNSDGSFGDGTWSKNGSDWLIKSTQTLPDGRAASGTFVLSPQDADQFSMKLIGHEIEGLPQPSKPAVVTRRVPEDADAADSDQAE